MLYDSTKSLLRGVVQSLEDTRADRWDDHAEAGVECLYEMHQMARSLYKGYRTEGGGGKPGQIPVHERAQRALPHVKLMVRAIRRKDKVAAAASGAAALAEL